MKRHEYKQQNENVGLLVLSSDIQAERWVHSSPETKRLDCYWIRYDKRHRLSVLRSCVVIHPKAQPAGLHNVGRRAPDRSAPADATAGACEQRTGYDRRIHPPCRADDNDDRNRATASESSPSIVRHVVAHYHKAVRGCRSDSAPWACRVSSA